LPAAAVSGREPASCHLSPLATVPAVGLNRRPALARGPQRLLAAHA